MLAKIATADRAALLDQWTGIHGKPPPKSLSVSFLRIALSYDVQAAASKGPSARVLRDLKRQTTGNAVATASGNLCAPGLKPGDQLLRTWNGYTYRVTVTEAGFDLEGRVWTSLSGLARHITGAHWSGPRFFGLTGRRQEPRTRPAVQDQPAVSA
ncbi:hypothetical protein AN191_18060 [Loktanella sp. 5RATIMAR09]|nr:hypothetical protein AN191_18060 [Loktanella sp. 5RATIMAR09]